MREDLVQTIPDIPVYLFTGFLEAGKTKFIRESLEDPRFNDGERTLLIVCEEGEEEYSPVQFGGGKVFVRTLEDEEMLDPKLLEAWRRQVKGDRVLIEYNGMWMLDSLYQSLPENWIVYQEFMFADARSFLSYNTNMRSLVYDKLKSCELVVFNRFPENGDIMAYHKIVRGANRSCDIAYEAPDGKVRYDDIVDPLPFDINGKCIVIEDGDYAIWYRDLGEELDKYQGKTVRFKAQVALSDELPAGNFVIGRQLMSCCVDDISFAGLIVEKCTRGGLRSGDWITLTASIRIAEHPGYDRPGPVLTALKVEDAVPPVDAVATF